MSRRWVEALVISAFVAGVPTRAFGFDFVEHSFVTDRACRMAQEVLGSRLRSGDASLPSRYLALSLTCPEAWTRPYCVDGYKQLEGSLNRLAKPPHQSGDYAITLGDFSALPDHLAAYGAVKGVPQAAREGLTTRTLRWLVRTGDAGGVISDVAEDGCETKGPLHWEALAGEPVWNPAWPAPPAAPSARAPVQRVVQDPAGAYSFDNPQYLDLVLHNHGHFGKEAYRNWTGFHATSRDLAAARCEDVLGADEDLLEDLADGLPAFEDVDWDDLPDAERATRACALVAERVRLRVLEWSARAAPELVAPVRAEVALLSGPASAERDALAQSLVSPLVALVFEGAGLHYLQDGLSGGHVRVQRLAYDLKGSRYQHDEDGQNGVPAQFTTSTRVDELVLFGDGFVLGMPQPGSACDALADAPPERITHCLLYRQRSALLTASTASLLHWAGTGNDFVRAHLPITAPGEPPPATRPDPDGQTGNIVLIPRGALPTPPPPFSYQSFLFSTSVDAAGGPPQVGVRTVFLSELDSRANWMTSYHFGLLARLGQGEQSQLTGEFSYMFHWRYAARFLINAGPFAYGGLGGFQDRAEPFVGAGPNVGISLLPEGWIRLPLELSLSYRMPVRIWDSRVPLRDTRLRIDAHWVELAVGLAFM